MTTTGGGRRPAAADATVLIPATPSAAPAPAAEPAPAAAPAPANDSLWRTVRSRRWHLVVAAVAALAVLATCGFFSYQLVQEELAGRDAQADSGEVPATVPQDISSREVDDEPLTVKEVFPNDEIVINPSEPPYQVLATERSKNCGVAAADQLAELLDKRGCSQVVRATMLSPNEAYLVTGGVLNLKAEQDAEQAYEDIKPLIEDGSGRFLGLLAGNETEPIVLSETVLFWDFRGHYLMYAVVARADGEEFSDADNSFADLLSWDIIEVHLSGGVLEQRATQPNPELPSDAEPEPSDSPAAEGEGG